MALKRNVREITSVVHKYDGIVDKSLTDGVICFFCHDYLGVGGEDHERRALMSAIEIQRLNKKAMEERSSEDAGRAKFPLRIGINSDLICIGNIGDKNRFDIALAGDGVIMAKRYEAACEPHKILLGKSTFDKLPEAFQQSEQCHLRYVSVKHLKDVQISYEFDAQSSPLSWDQVREAA